MKEFEVIPYTMEDGTIPFYEFMDKQSKKMQAKVLMELDLTREVS